MLTYSTFRNTDPPLLAALWRSLAGQPGLLQPVSSDLLEQLVFAKLYFDYRGLVIAREDGQPVGFAHAGFGANLDESWWSTDTGVTCVVLVRSDANQAEVAAGLLDRCEEYLRQRGARTLYGGGIRPFNPFYVGLYGSSDLPGILDTDTHVRSAFASRAYREVGRSVLFRRELIGFESKIDRQQMQARRQWLVEVTTDAPTRTLWEACMLGEYELTRFDVVPRGGGPTIASATFRGMEPSGAAAVSRAVSLMDVYVENAYRRRGLAFFLLSEAFRQFLRQGIISVEAVSRETDSAILGTFQKLELPPVGQAGIWKKDL